MQRAVAPSKADDQRFAAPAYASNSKARAPSVARELLRLSRAADVGPVLGDIRMPVLALHRPGDRSVGIENAREITGIIDRAMLVNCRRRSLAA